MQTQHTVAIIDIGSNSIKLLVARQNEQGTLDILAQQSQETRISAGISQQHPKLSAEALREGAKSVKVLAEAAHTYQPDLIQVVGTSAVRDALNQDLFAKAIWDRTKLQLRILSGKEEALAIAQGVLQDPALKALDDFCLFDLGGGSLELVNYRKGEIQEAISLPLGSVRLMEQFFPDATRPMTSRMADALCQYVTQTICGADFVFDPQVPLIATGGAMTVTRSLLSQDKPPAAYAEPANQYKRQTLEQLFAQVATATLEERLLLRGMPPKRADIFPVALGIILSLMRLGGYTALHHSFYNLRFGLAQELLRQLNKA
jgi:exopolyphosphatase/guanosine-5'-triphosphate,3'-diphosphate pyrophosphatase